MGDYNRNQIRYTDISGSSVLAAGDNLSVTKRELVEGVAGWTIFVQKATVNVVTDAAQTVQLEDSAGTPVVIAKTKASPGIGPIYFDFGPEGRALTEDESLMLANSAAGIAADVTWSGYMRQTASTPA